ncbi:MAG TPA: hypothetical protein VGC13_15600 [Longimicrobium sp.]|jgi:hypothetical protein|uniref:hypothetical protein n=1 Tax=Longimicrobium sp. TaxID=2029185 RepID=UPI002ED9CBEA
MAEGDARRSFGMTDWSAVARLAADAQVPGDAARTRAAESAQADFAPFQRRIHSLLEAGCTIPGQNRDGHHSLSQ